MPVGEATRAAARDGHPTPSSTKMLAYVPAPGGCAPVVCQRLLLRRTFPVLLGRLALLAGGKPPPLDATRLPLAALPRRLLFPRPLAALCRRCRRSRAALRAARLALPLPLQRRLLCPEGGEGACTLAALGRPLLPGIPG